MSKMRETASREAASRETESREAALREAASREAALREIAKGMPETTVMEVCGTHTFQVARYAIKDALPENMRLISGPGCPVCVTAGEDILAAVYAVTQKDAVLYSFGDMLRVPVDAGGESLMGLRSSGADVRVALSPMDALKAAQNEPKREVVYFAVGFETTAPLTAAMLKRARDMNIRNLSVISAHKTMPQALKCLLKGTTRVDALLCPGHVAVITGADEFEFVPKELGLAAAVSGFEPSEILLALTEIASMRRDGKTELKNCYKKAVSAGGNAVAKALISGVFEPCDAIWRGLGKIERSGLKIKEEYACFDARKRFNIDAHAFRSAKLNTMNNGCACGEILRGEKAPSDCPLFGKVCTPEKPMGPCMVSNEGACAAKMMWK